METDSPGVSGVYCRANSGMTLKLARFAAALLLLVSMDGLAVAQSNVIGGRVGGGAVPNTSATAAVTGQAADAGVEPHELAGMLAAQNEARQHVGLPGLKWSSELASRAEATAKAASNGTCSMSGAQRVARTENASFYWATAMRRFAGGNAVQDISANYLVSRWREGSSDYDAAKGLCRTKSSSCEPYSRMVAPAARTVGCARTICSSQAQVWICLYSDQILH